MRGGERERYVDISKLELTLRIDMHRVTMSCSQEAVQHSRARRYVRSQLRHHFVTIAATNCDNKDVQTCTLA